jgi:hypothetical protein
VALLFELGLLDISVLSDVGEPRCFVHDLIVVLEVSLVVGCLLADELIRI